MGFKLFAGLSELRDTLPNAGPFLILLDAVFDGRLQGLWVFSLSHSKP